MYSPGDIVHYKNYTGRIRFAYRDKYMVTLYNYRGFKALDRLCYENELWVYEQISLFDQFAHSGDMV